jgi:hypothetical protein
MSLSQDRQIRTSPLSRRFIVAEESNILDLNCLPGS